MQESQKSYRQIFKATSLFGSVQVFGIIINIIRSKAIAVLLGPVGIGVYSLLNTTISMVGSFTNLGLGSSAIKNVAAANATNDRTRIAIVVTVFRKLVWFTGLLGSAVTLIFSSLLSKLTFGNTDYTFAFVFISITLLLNQISVGQRVILRGTRQLKFMTQSGIIGSLFGLIMSLPLYYLYGIKGIVPTIIITSVTALLLSSYFSNKVKIDKIYVNFSTLKNEGREMISMGIMLSLSGTLSLATSYLLRIFISNTGGVDQVGLFSAGFAIINSYVGMVFTAMSTDYYPSLSGIAHDNKLASKLINEQSEMALLILAPIIVVFIVFNNYIVTILYSNKFTDIYGMLQWSALGMFFKTGSWAIGYLLLAKSASKIFFWNELISNIYFLILNIVGYKLFGLEGLGISFLIGYLLYFIQINTLSKIKYQFSISKSLKTIFSIQFILALISFILCRMINSPWHYYSGILIIILSITYTLYEINRKIRFVSFLKTITKNRKP